MTLALLALLLFGATPSTAFTAVMMFGVVLVGTYTSIFIAAPILIYLGVGEHRDAPEKAHEEIMMADPRTLRIFRSAPIEATARAARG